MARPTSRRSYDDACGAAHALDLVGERWALLVMRELMFGPKRFSELRGDLPGISAKLLTQRLEDLEAAGILIKRRLPPPASAQVYELTEWGYESEPIFQVLGRWAVRSPGHDPTLPLSAASLLLSFRTMFDPAKAGSVSARIGLHFGRETFVALIKDGSISIARDELRDVPVALEGAPAVIAAAVYGGVPLAELEAQGAIRLRGDRALAETFVGLFQLPSKVSDRAPGPVFTAA